MATQTYGKIATSEAEKAANRAALQKSLAALGAQSTEQNGNVVVTKTAPNIKVGPIPATDMTKQLQPINLPQKTPVADQSMNIAQGNAQLGITLNPQTGRYEFPQQSNTSQLTPEQAEAQGKAQRLAEMQDLLGLQPKQASVEDTYNAVYKSSEDANLRDQYQKQVNDYTNQINAIQAKTQADQLSLEGRGEGVPDVIIGGQQAQVAKEAAIRTIPIQAQLAAAQGNLTLAQDRLDTLFKVKSADAQNDYEYKKMQFDAIRQFVDREQNIQLQRAEKAADRAYQETQDNLKNLEEWSKLAVQNGQTELIGQFGSLNPNSPTFRQDLAKIQGKVVNADVILDREYKRAQIENIKAQTSSAGTTTLKERNQAQLKADTFAKRMDEANSKINELVEKHPTLYNAFTGTISKFVPNQLKTEVRQEFDQAKRNFINAALRPESGATISPQEFENAELQYFPQPGDSDAVIQQKKQNREAVILGQYQEAGYAIDQVELNKAQEGDLNYINSLNL